jgi:hypothetical protein
MKIALSWAVTPCGFLGTNVLEERISSNIRVQGISELGTT